MTSSTAIEPLEATNATMRHPGTIQTPTWSSPNLVAIRLLIRTIYSAEPADGVQTTHVCRASFFVGGRLFTIRASLRDTSRGVATCLNRDWSYNRRVPPCCAKWNHTCWRETAADTVSGEEAFVAQCKEAIEQSLALAFA